jgi:lambda repressor-like predicted transcriptional regulator
MAKIRLTGVMPIYPSISDIPENPAVRGAWVVFKLRVAGSSLKAVGDLEGVTKQAVSNAVSRAGGNGSSERLEKAVAAALRLPVKDLFPERYDPSTGLRKRAVSVSKTTTPSRPRNVKAQEAA